MSVDGAWNITMPTPLGEEKSKLTLDADGSVLKGTMESNVGSAPIFDGTVAGDKVAWKVNITVPTPMTLDFSGTVDGNKMSGNVKLGGFGSTTFSGSRQ